MGILEMRDSDLQELYLLLQMYINTYDKQDITDLLQSDILQRLEERNIDPNMIGNVRNAGRKRKPENIAKDEEILRLHSNGLSIRQISDQTGVSKSCVHKLISGQYNFSS